MSCFTTSRRKREKETYISTTQTKRRKRPCWKKPQPFWKNLSAIPPTLHEWRRSENRELIQSLYRAYRKEITWEAALIRISNRTTLITISDIKAFQQNGCNVQTFFEQILGVKRDVDLLLYHAAEFELKITDKIDVSKILASFSFNDALPFHSLEYLLRDFNWNIQYSTTHYKPMYVPTCVSQYFTVLELIFLYECTFARFEEFVLISEGEWDWISQWKGILQRSLLPQEWYIVRRIRPHIEAKIQNEIMTNKIQSELITFLGTTYIPVASLWSSLICPYFLHLQPLCF